MNRTMQWGAPTPQDWTESVREWARVYGSTRPEQAWLLHDRDVWVENPYYRGPRVAHPESEE